MAKTKFARAVERSLRKTYPSIRPVACPEWLSASRWRTPTCWSVHGQLLAVDSLPSGAVPARVYRDAVRPLMQEHADLEVLVVCREEALEENGATEKICRELRIGLKAYVPKVGLLTVVANGLDHPAEATGFVDEPGWFPEKLLDAAAGTGRLSFSQELLGIVAAIRAAGANRKEALAVVHRGIGCLLQMHPHADATIASFMKVEHFEAMLRLADNTETEHIFHSFRVFLAGCPVLSENYEVFTDAHTGVTCGNADTMSVEYCWLLASLFHDIGKPYEKAHILVEKTLDDDDVEAPVHSTGSLWTRPENRDARRLLASLMQYRSSSNGDQHWDFGAVSTPDNERNAEDLTRLYGGFTSHAVVGAIHLLSSIVKKSAAADRDKNRSFVLTHAVPAALAVLLHDWKVWEVAASWGLFPLKGDRIPLAALLVFLDTWDDFRRSGDRARVYVRDYTVERGQVSVSLDWEDGTDLKHEEVKFSAFREAIIDSPISYTIDPKVSSS